MLDYSCQRASEVLKIPQTAILATTGPAGIMAGEFPCEACGLHIYLLLPQTSDHLFNLEDNDSVALLTPIWEVQGRARVVPKEAIDLNLLRKPGCEWDVLVQIVPLRIQIRREAGWGNIETIDFTGR